MTGGERISEADSAGLARWVRQQESLREIVEAISGGKELQPLLALIVQRACEVLGAEKGAIGLVDRQRHVIRLEVVYGQLEGEVGAELPPGVGLAGQILLTQQPLVLNRYGEVAQPVLAELADDAVMGVPVCWRGQMAGVLGVGAAPPRRFEPQEVETLTLFAHHAAIAIGNVQLVEAEKRGATHLATINRIGQLLNSGLSLNQLLQVAIETICQDLHLGSLGLGLVDPDDPEMLVLHAATGVYAAYIPKDYRQSIHEGICGAAARTRQPVLLNDVSRDPRYIPMAGVSEIYAELAVPVVINDRLLGVLNVESPQPITEEEVAGLEVVAHQLGVAIENGRLFAAEKRRVMRLAIINRVSRLIAGSLDLDQLLQTTVEAIWAHLYYHNVALLLLDPLDPEMLVLRASSGIYAVPEIDNYRQSIQQGIIGAAAQNRQRLLILDVQSDPRYIPIPRSGQIYAELAVPIIVGNRLLGVLNVESEQVITEEDAAGFEIIADQLGVAIDNARLFAEIQGALDQAQLLYETIGRISTAMDVDEVVQAYLEQVAARGRYACNVVLYEFDEGGQRTAVIVHGRWTPQDGFVRVEERLPYTQDSLDPLLDAGQTITFADIQTDLRAPTGLRQMQLQDRRPALALIPLMVRGQRIGLVVLSYASVHEWRDIDLQPYQATAAQLATAIDSRRQQQLLFERGQQIAVLQERQRLARDLHDSVTQLIFSMTLIAQSIAPAWRRDAAEGERRVQRLLELSQSALVEMRALLAELRPPEPTPTLSEDESEAVVQSTLSPIPINVYATSPLPGILQVQRDGLVVALRRYLADVARDGLQIDLETSGYIRQTLQQEEAFYRIVQEALNNVVKHANARRVKINLCVNDHLTHLTVTDDGRGFAQEPTPTLAAPSPREIKKAGGLGLMTMRERAEALGGMIQLRTALGRGTTVAVTIPRKDE